MRSETIAVSHSSGVSTASAPPEGEQVEAAVEFSSFDNMKKMESGAQSLLAGGRMKPRDKDNPDSYKVRRAKVGGYRDYFSDEEVAAIDARLAQTLDPMYGYQDR